jgi:hypothetical protein
MKLPKHSRRSNAGCSFLLTFSTHDSITVTLKKKKVHWSQINQRRFLDELGEKLGFQIQATL